MTTAKASGERKFRRRGESEVAMKKLCVGVVLASALLFAQSALADPCGLCQAYYPCWWPCQHCVEGNGGPGLWEIDGGCWGVVEEGTCGDIGQCTSSPSTDWSFKCAESGGIKLEQAQPLPDPAPAAVPRQ